MVGLGVVRLVVVWPGSVVVGSGVVLVVVWPGSVVVGSLVVVESLDVVVPGECVVVGGRGSNIRLQPFVLLQQYTQSSCRFPGSHSDIPGVLYWESHSCIFKNNHYLSTGTKPSKVHLNEFILSDDTRW